EPPATFPAPISDSLNAVRWIRAHAALYGVDAKRMAVLGSSAGGNLAAVVATAGKGSRVRGSRVAAAVTWSGPMDLAAMASEQDSRAGRVVEHYLACPPSACPARYRTASPVAAVDRTDAPMLIANSTNELVPLSQATEMARKLKKAGVRYQLVAVPGSLHARAYESRVWATSLRFLERYLGRLPVQEFTAPAAARS